MMQLRFLGTGWSHGVPVIGCDCSVCTEGHPRNRRRRPSIHLTDGQLSIVVDVGPDFRDQALSFGLRRLDGVFITHQHADHVMGLDDVRRFTWTRPDPLEIWAEPQTRARLAQLYPYVALERCPEVAVPRACFRDWREPVRLGDLQFTPFAVPHGDLPCLGIRVDGPGGASLGYVPDCSDLPADALAQLRGVRVMVLNALRLHPHPTHLTLERSLELLRQIGAPRSYLTHLGCPIDYREWAPRLPPGIELAWDGLEINC